MIDDFLFTFRRRFLETIEVVAQKSLFLPEVPNYATKTMGNREPSPNLCRFEIFYSKIVSYLQKFYIFAPNFKPIRKKFYLFSKVKNYDEN